MFVSREERRRKCLAIAAGATIIFSLSSKKAFVAWRERERGKKGTQDLLLQLLLFFVLSSLF